MWGGDVVAQNVRDSLKGVGLYLDRFPKNKKFLSIYPHSSHKINNHIATSGPHFLRAMSESSSATPTLPPQLVSNLPKTTKAASIGRNRPYNPSRRGRAWAGLYNA